MLFEKREILNITLRVAVLSFRVPDVKLDVGETVIRALAAAVLVLDLEPVFLGELVSVDLGFGLRVLTEVQEREELRAGHVSWQLLALDLELPTDLTPLVVVRSDPSRRPPSLPPHFVPRISVSHCDGSIPNRELRAPVYQ